MLLKLAFFGAMSIACGNPVPMLVTGMGKRIYWVLVALVTLCGMSTLVYFAIQPRPVQKIKINPFQNSEALADAVIASMRTEIQDSALLILGVETRIPDSIQIWKRLIQQMPFDVVVVDQSLNGVDDIQDLQKFDTFKESQRLISGLKDLLDQGKRVVILVPTLYSVQMIPGNVANQIKLKYPDVMSLSMTDIPRSREQEKRMPKVCNVAFLDEGGLGPYGCLVIQTARANYMKRFDPGAHVAQLDQIGLNDYLLLYTIEAR